MYPTTEENPAWQAQPSRGIRSPQSLYLCPKHRKTSIRKSSYETQQYRDLDSLFHFLLNFLFKNPFHCFSLYHFAWCSPLFCEHLPFHPHFMQGYQTAEVNLPFFLVHQFSSNNEAQLFGAHSLMLALCLSPISCPVPPISEIPRCSPTLADRGSYPVVFNLWRVSTALPGGL